MKYPIVSFMVLLFSFNINMGFSHAAALQGDASLGELKTPSCRFCHGNNGIAPSPLYPNLQGQHAAYLLDSMRSYQQERRTGPMAEMMKQQLSKLSEQDLADIAAYYQAMGANQ